MVEFYLYMFIFSVQKVSEQSVSLHTAAMVELTPLELFLKKDNLRIFFKNRFKV